MALVVLLLGAMALVHSVSTGSGIIGNLGFKQDATASGDRVTQAALTWLSTHASSLDDNDEADGYYATNLDGLDATGSQSSDSSRVLVNWGLDGCAYASSGTYTSCKRPSDEMTVQDSKARYIITRLCLNTGDPDATGNSCQKPLDSGSSSTPAKRGALNYGDYERFSGTTGPYYRIIARVVGARNTVSYTETIVHF
jgi:hypothetical protein